MKKVLDEDVSGANSDVNCTKTHEYTKWYKISVIEMTNTVVYPCYQVWSRKLSHGKHSHGTLKKKK